MLKIMGYFLNVCLLPMAILIAISDARVFKANEEILKSSKFDVVTVNKRFGTS